MSKGYTGISFPFRIGVKGGVVLSTTDRYGVQHIEESLIQILGTNFGERVMEGRFGSDLDTQIFSPNDEVTHGIIKYQIVEAIKIWDKRVKVTEEGISIRADGEKLFADIHFEVIGYSSGYDTTIQIGGE